MLRFYINLCERGYDMRKLFSLVWCVCFVFPINGQEYNITNGIVLSEQNQGAGLTIVFRSETEIKSAWDRGTVIRYSNNPQNETNLGKFIEIEYDMGFEFEGSFISQGEMRIIFSNLLEINIVEETQISKGALIGKTKKDSGNDLRVFILSNTDNLQFLKMWTNNKKVKIGDYWYWDPAFLFR
jgi:hypothetical protein